MDLSRPLQRPYRRPQPALSRRRRRRSTVSRAKGGSRRSAPTRSKARPGCWSRSSAWPTASPSSAVRTRSESASRIEAATGDDRRGRRRPRASDHGRRFGDRHQDGARRRPPVVAVDYGYTDVPAAELGAGPGDLAFRSNWPPATPCYWRAHSPDVLPNALWTALPSSPKAYLQGSAPAARRTPSSTAASASRVFAPSGPPAWAMSGRPPPPLPPSAAEPRRTRSTALKRPCDRA